MFEAAPEFPTDFADWPLVGERPDWWQGAYADVPAADAEVLIEVALRMLAAGQAVPVEAGLPEYFNGDSPWRKAR